MLDSKKIFKPDSSFAGNAFQSGYFRQASDNTRTYTAYIVIPIDDLPCMQHNVLMINSALSNAFDKDCKWTCVSCVDDGMTYLGISLQFKNAHTVSAIGRHLDIYTRYIWIPKDPKTMYVYQSIAGKNKYIWSNTNMALHLAWQKTNMAKHSRLNQALLEEFTLGNIDELDLFNELGLYAYSKMLPSIRRARTVRRDVQHLVFKKNMNDKPTKVVFMDDACVDFAKEKADCDISYANLLSQHNGNDQMTSINSKNELAIKQAEKDHQRYFYVSHSTEYCKDYDGQEMLIVNCKDLSSGKFRSKAFKNLMFVLRGILLDPTNHDLHIMSGSTTVPLNCKTLVLMNAGMLADQLPLNFDIPTIQKIQQSPDKYSYYGFPDDYVNLESTL